MERTDGAMLGKGKASAQSGLDTSIFDATIEAGSVADRRQLADELARFSCDSEASAAERKAIVPQLLKLATDPDFSVQETLARGLVYAKELHADVVFTLVAGDDDVALPFIAAARSLDGWRMAAIVRVGDVARQIRIARRPDLAAEAIDEILRKGEAEVALALLDNRQAPLTPKHCRTLYSELGREPAILERLLSWPGLPVDIRIAQARLASRRILRLVTERGWLAPVDADEIVSGAADATILDLLAGAEPDDLSAAIAFMAEKDMLTPAVLLRAACVGEMQVVAAGLAHLSGVGINRAQKMMYGRSTMRARALLRRAGIPESCHAVLRAAMTVERQAAEDELELDAEDFGRQMIAAMMIEFHSMPERERARQLDHVGRFADESVRMLARRVKADLARAA
jgi:uncharacterized protein (DUF2336 family)